MTYANPTYKTVADRGVGTGGAQGARAPPKFLPRPKSALFRDKKCALFASGGSSVSQNKL